MTIGDEVEWSDVSSSFGSAADVPKLLDSARNSTDDDPYTSFDQATLAMRHVLHGATLNQHAPSFASLLMRSAQGTASASSQLGLLRAAVVLGDARTPETTLPSLTPQPATVAEPRGISATTLEQQALSEQVWNILRAQKGWLGDLASQGDPRIRAVAARLLLDAARPWERENVYEALVPSAEVHATPPGLLLLAIGDLAVRGSAQELKRRMPALCASVGKHGVVETAVANAAASRFLGAELDRASLEEAADHPYDPIDGVWSFPAWDGVPGALLVDLLMASERPSSRDTLLHELFLRVDARDAQEDADTGWTLSGWLATRWIESIRDRTAGPPPAPGSLSPHDLAFVRALRSATGWRNCDAVPVRLLGVEDLERDLGWISGTFESPLAQTTQFRWQQRLSTRPWWQWLHCWGCRSSSTDEERDACVQLLTGLARQRWSSLLDIAVDLLQVGAFDLDPRPVVEALVASESDRQDWSHLERTEHPEVACLYLILTESRRRRSGESIGISSELEALASNGRALAPMVEALKGST